MTHIALKATMNIYRIGLIIAAISGLIMLGQLIGQMISYCIWVAVTRAFGEYAPECILLGIAAASITVAIVKKRRRHESHVEPPAAPAAGAGDIIQSLVLLVGIGLIAYGVQTTPKNEKEGSCYRRGDCNGTDTSDTSGGAQRD